MGRCICPHTSRKKKVSSGSAASIRRSVRARTSTRWFRGDIQFDLTAPEKVLHSQDGNGHGARHKSLDKNRVMIEEGYETYRDMMLKKPYADPSAMKLRSETIAESNPKAKNMNLMSLVDSSFVERLDCESAFDRIRARRALPISSMDRIRRPLPGVDLRPGSRLCLRRRAEVYSGPPR